MNIYFSGSIRGGRNDSDKYRQLINELKQYGKVLTEQVGAHTTKSKISDSEIRNRDISLLKKSNVVVADTTIPSLGVGYELAYAEFLNIPTIVLHDPKSKQLSAMISGTNHFNCFKYSNIDQAKNIIKTELNKIVSNNK